MAQETVTKRADRLKVNDTIICPVTGLPEKVTSTHKYVGGRWFFRTTRHDHCRPREERIEVASRSGEQP